MPVTDFYLKISNRIRQEVKFGVGAHVQLHYMQCMGDCGGHMILMDMSTILTMLLAYGWHTLGKLQLGAGLGCAISLMMGAWCLLMLWRLSESPRQGGTPAKGMAVELGPSDVAFSSASESPQSSHLSSFLAWDTMCKSGCELQLCYLVPDYFVSMFHYAGRGQTVWAANASLDVSTKLNSTATGAWSELRAICIP